MAGLDGFFDKLINALSKAWDKITSGDGLSSLFASFFGGAAKDPKNSEKTDAASLPEQQKSSAGVNPQDKTSEPDAKNTFNSAAAYGTFQKLDGMTYGLNKKGRSYDSNQIDCSGFSGTIMDGLTKNMNATAAAQFTAAVYNINPKTGKPYTDQEDKESKGQVYRFKNAQQIQDGLEKVIKDNGGTLTLIGKGKSKESLINTTIKDGSFLFLNTGYDEWEKKGLNGKIRPDGADHCAYVTKNTQGDLVVIESIKAVDKDGDGKTGVQETPLKEWLERYKDAELRTLNVAEAAIKMGNKMPGPSA